MQRPGFHGTPEPGGALHRQLLAPSSWAARPRDEQRVVQAVAVQQAGQRASLAAAGQGNPTQAATPVPQGGALISGRGRII